MNRMLDEEITRDPVPLSVRGNGHLYVVAHPLTAHKDAALEFVQGAEQPLYNLIHSAEDRLHGRLRELVPGPDYATEPTIRAHGRALSSSDLAPGRTFDPASFGAREKDLLDIEVREDGGIRILSGRMARRLSDDSDSAPKVITDGLAVAYAVRIVRWAATLGETCGYNGTWSFGIAATGLRGASSLLYDPSPHGFRRGPVYDVDTYRETTTATTLELRQQPWNVAGRLVSRLLRGLRTTEYYDPALTEPPTDP